MPQQVIIGNDRIVRVVETGPVGPPGPPGPPGDPGSGGGNIPAGGTTGDFVKKLSATDFDVGFAPIAKSDVGLANVDNTSDANKPVSTAQQTALNLKAPLASPVFTGTVSGITKAMVGLGSVDNTADTAKPVSTAQQAALDLKAPLASPTFTGTVIVPDQSFNFNKIQNVATARLLGRNTAGAGSIEELTAATAKTLLALVKGDVGLANVDNTSDANKPVSTAQQTALDLKAPLASPTFTGTVAGITKGMVGLGNVDNTSDANKPVSTAQQTALDLKANLRTPGTLAAMPAASSVPDGTFYLATDDGPGTLYTESGNNWYPASAKNRDLGHYEAAPGTPIDQSITATTYTAITNVSVSFTSAVLPVKIESLSWASYNSVAAFHYGLLALFIDDVEVAGTSTAVAPVKDFGGTNAALMQTRLVIIVTGLSAGAHTVNLRAKATSPDTIRVVQSSVTPIRLYVTEVVS